MIKILLASLIFPFVTSLLLTTCVKQITTTVVDNNVDSIPMVGLKDINPSILIGSPLDMSFNNEKYRNIVKKEFSMGESLWYARWDGWASKDVYDFSSFSNNVNWMKANNISPTMHMLVGPDLYMPDWLINGQWQKKELDSMLRRTIYAIMDTNDNKSKVDIWNVINELFDDDGTYRKEMLWKQLGWEKDNSQLTGEEQINTMHPVFIRKAFQYAREKTNKKLELRDFGIESDKPSYEFYKKTKAIYQLIKHMQNEKIPLDALGIQGHISTGKSDLIFYDNTLRETIKKFKALGIDVYITELDIRTENQTWTQNLANQQKSDYYNYVKQAIEGGVSRISFWGIQDGFDPYWLLTEHPLLWDENLNKKAAYLGVKKALSSTK